MAITFKHSTVDSLLQVIDDFYTIIDDLHIWNNRDQSCRPKYSMDDLRAENHNFNTMPCEQTFAWLSRHKKIICTMNKCHFLFYLHRLVKRTS